MAISALLGAAVVGVLLLRGHSVRPSKVSLPFLEMSISRFDGLSAVKRFVNISAAVLSPRVAVQREATTAALATPVVFIHTGWNIVCEAFVRRFGYYPDDDRIHGAAAVIGGQNVEFVKMYRDIHAAAIRHAETVAADFAANYLARAPSLAERIEGALPPLEGLPLELLTVANELRQGG